MDTKKRIIGALILTAVIILLGIIIPLTLGLGTGEIAEQEVANQIDFYQKFYWALIVIWAVFLTFILLKNNNRYGDNMGFFGGEKPAIPFFRRFSAVQLTLISLIFFGILFLIANSFELGGFTGLRVLPQQFTPTQSLLFSTLLIPAPENLLLGAIISLFALGLTLFAMKIKMPPKEYATYLFIGLFVLGATFGIIWHRTAYPTSDISSVVIGLFWGLGAVICVGVGSFIPFWVMHSLNNFFIDFSRLYTSDLLLYFMGFVILGLVILYGYIYRKNGEWYRGVR